jgi:Tfp pilus assembly protein PilN
MIKQFTINLNKGEGEQVLRNRRQERRSYLVLGLFALVFAVLGGLTWAQNKAMNDVLESRKAKLDRIRFELDSLKREATKVSKDDVSALARLENERFLWARRLEKLAEILPAGVAITGIELQNKVFKINALAQVDSSRKDFEIISKFIELLKSSPEFRQGLFDIRFDQSLHKKMEEQEVLNFTVECLTTDPEAKKTRKAAVPTPSSSGPKLPAVVTQT